jgi:hypothetical protein
MKQNYSRAKKTETIDLTRHPGCFTHFLISHMEELSYMSVDDSTSLAQLKAKVFEIIEPAYYNAEAKARFIMYIMASATRDIVIKRCMQSIANAKTFAVTPKEKADYETRLAILTRV